MDGLPPRGLPRAFPRGRADGGLRASASCCCRCWVRARWRASGLRRSVGLDSERAGAAARLNDRARAPDHPAACRDPCRLNAPCFICKGLLIQPLGRLVHHAPRLCPACADPAGLHHVDARADAHQQALDAMPQAVRDGATVGRGATAAGCSSTSTSLVHQPLARDHQLVVTPARPCPAAPVPPPAWGNTFTAG